MTLLIVGGIIGIVLLLGGVAIGRRVLPDSDTRSIEAEARKRARVAAELDGTARDSSWRVLP